MGTAKRMQLIRILNKMERNPELSEKIGIKDKSQFRFEKEKRMNYDELGINAQRKERYDVNVIIFNMHVMGVWKVIHFRSKGRLGNFKIFADSSVPAGNINHNGSRWTAFFSISDIDRDRNCRINQFKSVMRKEVE